MNYQEITVLAGLSQRPTTCFTVTDRDGLTWYVCEFGTVVNATYEPIVENTNIEAINDVDCMTFNEPFMGIYHFESVMEDYV